MNKELQNWAEKVIKEITPDAINLNKDYYPFQSKAIENPDILFLGLNPGGGSSYESQSTKDKWEFIDSFDEKGKSIKVMKPERLLGGNPFFEINSDEWKFIKGLRKISMFDKALNENKFVLANYFYLSTADFYEAETFHKDVFEKCKKLTYEMIQLIKPKLIVVLGTSKGIDQLDEFKNKRLILSGNHQRLLISADYNNTKVIAIPHPSLMAITEKEIEAINTNILELIEEKPFTNYEFKKINFSQFSINNIEKIIEEKGIKADFVQNKNVYDWIIDNGTNKILVRFSVKDKYFGIRDFNAKTSGSPNRFYINIENADLYISTITKPLFFKTNSWTVQKFFSQYEFDNLSALYQLIATDLTNLYHKIINAS